MSLNQYLHRRISLNFTEDLVEMLVPVGSGGGGMDCPPTLSRPAVEIRLGETSHIPYLLLSREKICRLQIDRDRRSN